MKKLIIVILLLAANVYSQSSFTQEWESPIDKRFVAISSWEHNNSIPEIVFQSIDRQTIYVYDGATKQIKYTYSNPDEIYHFVPEFCIKDPYTPIDVNNDGIFEIITYRNYPNPTSSVVKVINGANGGILFQNTYSDYDCTIKGLCDIDGDGYAEICIYLGNTSQNIEKLLILSTTSNYVSINNTSSGVDSYKLKQNYPNPFNPNTKIEYTLTKSADVRLAIYDITGKEIASIVNEKQNAGTYIKDLSGTNLSSGTYFYQLSVNGNPETKKMVLVK